MYYIGIDLGTSLIKCMLMDEAGRVCGLVSGPVTTLYPQPGWSEQEPDAWWETTKSLLKELISGYPAEEIAGIGLSGQMHGLVILDEEDQVIRPAILWNDARTGKEVTYLNEVIGRENLSHYTANIAFAGFTAPKILWLRKNEPENFRRIRKVLLPKDYLSYRLTGVYATDYSDASGTLLLDVQHRCWSPVMLQLCSLKEEQMPKLYESYAPIGTLTPEIAAELGLTTGVKVAAGASANAAAAIGTGTVGDDQCNISLGSSGTLFISSTDFMVDKFNALHSFDHADGNYHLLGCMLCAESARTWWMEDVLQAHGTEGEPKITEEDLGRNQVWFVPYLMGERSPHNDPDARGTFIGMRMDSSRKDMSQAVLEGVAFAIRDSMEIARSLGFSISHSTISGDGARIGIWQKILANVLNVRLEQVANEEGACFGAAILAAVACGAYTDVESAADILVHIENVIEPDPEIVARYEECYFRYREIYPVLKPLYAIL